MPSDRRAITPAAALSLAVLSEKSNEQLIEQVQNTPDPALVLTLKGLTRRKHRELLLPEEEAQRLALLEQWETETFLRLEAIGVLHARGVDTLPLLLPKKKPANVEEEPNTPPLDAG